MTADTHPIEKEQVMAYLDGELSPQATARVVAHLQECSECRTVEAELRGVASEMLAWTIEPSSALLVGRVNTELQAKPIEGLRNIRDQFHELSRSFRRLLLNRWTWATACSVVALVIVFMVYSPRDQKILVGSNALQEFAAARPTPMVAAQSSAARGKAFEDSNSLSRQAHKAPPAQVKGESAFTSPLGPMIARTASLNVSVKDFAAARAAIDRIIAMHHGYAANLTISSQKNEPQSLEASLQIPSAECDAALAALKALGHVQQEQQGGEEVTAQVVDLDARLKNARITETRLEEILRTRTGKVSDVLEVEKEISDVRENIEQMEAQQKALHNRISFAAIQLSLHEEYEASLDVASSSVGRRIRNAFVDGFHAATDGLVGFCVFLLNVSPSLILAAVILFWPARFAWRRLHKA